MIKGLRLFLSRLFGTERRTETEDTNPPADEIEVSTEARQPAIEIATGRPFGEFPLDERILKGLDEAAFIRGTEIQERSLPHTLSGKDIAAQAQTGSGKTAVFLLTIFQRFLEKKERGEKIGRALILAPTRELALQIHRDAELLGRHCGLRYAVILGGLAYEAQIEALKSGAEVIIATPGRLIDLMKQHLLNPLAINILVIDEADRMLDMGFIRDLRYIMRRLPHYSQRQSLLFSATLSARVVELTYEYMDVAEEIVIKPEDLVVETVDQCLHHVGQGEKFKLLLGLLKRESWERVLIFTNTKAEASQIARRLSGNEYTASAITGDLSQKRRISILNRFRTGKVPILVATDVASRGLHIEDVSHVINYDVPQDREEYVHRIGRTARAGKSGKAITLATERDVYYLAPIEDLLGRKIPVVWPEDSWFVADQSRGWRERRPRKPQKKEGGERGPRRYGSGPKRKRSRKPKGGPRNAPGAKPRGQRRGEGHPKQKNVQKQS